MISKTLPIPIKLLIKSSNAYLADLAESKSKSNNQSQNRALQPDPDAARVIHNSKQSGNLASVGNNANASAKHENYSQMSDDDFRKLKARNLFMGGKK